MSTFLFDKTIFGPVKSRRLGNSLGINLLPNTRKVCNFNCIYCECGWNPEVKETEKLPSVEMVSLLLEQRLKEMKANKEPIDVITFAGNGEPTMHPAFPEIIDATIAIRNKYFPGIKIAILSNSTLLHKPKVFEALMKVDQNILKIDSVFEKTCMLLNNPVGHFDINEIIQNLLKFKGNLIIQTMFVKGNYNGIQFDNSSDNEVNGWLQILKKVSPSFVMIYTIARDTSANGLEKVSAQKLKKILALVEETGFKGSISD
jgi:wyosine [tRNA(Phe)-imidazoG37] synthetase (radical SAM superfamily)